MTWHSDTEWVNIKHETLGKHTIVVVAEAKSKLLHNFVTISIFAQLDIRKKVLKRKEIYFGLLSEHNECCCCNFLSTETSSRARAGSWFDDSESGCQTGLDNQNHNNPTVPVSEQPLSAGGVTSHVSVAGGHGGGRGGGLSSLPASGVLTAGERRETHVLPRAARQNRPERERWWWGFGTVG